MGAVEEFSPEERARARAYHRPLYAALLLDLALAAGLLGALAWSALGDWLFSPLGSLQPVVAAALYAALVTVFSVVMRVPLSFWRGWWRERSWGFSTQSAGGWLADRAKGLAVSVVLAAAAWAAAVALARALPGWWVVPAAAALALAVLLLSFVAPVLLEPLFNRFRPLGDEALAAELHSLSDRAGVPVRDVLVADASRRTTKVNAYVSGIGRTRRVVVFDTLLETAGPAEVEVVVAHELGHRRDRHVAKGTLLAMAGAAFAVIVLWAVLGTRIAEPQALPEALLLLLALEVVALPPGSWLSRRWERAADRCSLDLTGDPAAFAAAHAGLARRNLSDLEPPRLVYAVLFSHPTPPERLALGREWSSSQRDLVASPGGIVLRSEDAVEGAADAHDRS
ncbi:MAG TPA: M48 family metalloprotease [Gaiellaceae bacterium]|nr:M48 family metalloprotease [Gaiellaceae bacterium]